MSDLIDRQDAIDAINAYLGLSAVSRTIQNMTSIQEILENLPSAEKAQLSEEDATFDCISRQEAIDVEGLDEQIRCEMCRNPMHTNKGCDGNCKYDEKLYERIMQILGERIKPLPSAEPERVWTPCDIPPEHHRDVIVRGIEAIGGKCVYKVMQWDVDTWRPKNYAPSITWLDWSEI